MQNQGSGGFHRTTHPDGDAKEYQGPVERGSLALWFGLLIIARRRSLQIAQGDDSHQVFLPI